MNGEQLETLIRLLRLRIALGRRVEPSSSILAAVNQALGNFESAPDHTLASLASELENLAQK